MLLCCNKEHPRIEAGEKCGEEAKREKGGYCQAERWGLIYSILTDSLGYFLQHGPVPRHLHRADPRNKSRWKAGLIWQFLPFCLLPNIQKILLSHFSVGKVPRLSGSTTAQHAQQNCQHEDKFFNYFCIHFVLAPAIVNIDSYIKKDVLNVLGKVTQIAPVELGSDAKVVFLYEYFLLFLS